jgi:hypothetical protein
MKMKTIQAKKIAERSNRFGANYRDVARHYFSLPPGRGNNHEMGVLGCIVAADSGTVIYPENLTIKIALSKTRKKWCKQHNIQDSEMARSKFLTEMNNAIKTMLDSYGDEFMEFAMGDSSLMEDPRTTEKQKNHLRFLDFYLTEIADHIRY